MPAADYELSYQYDSPPAPGPSPKKGGKGPKTGGRRGKGADPSTKKKSPEKSSPSKRKRHTSESDSEEEVLRLKSRFNSTLSRNCLVT